jgi:hypothetical protein
MAYSKNISTAYVDNKGNVLTSSWTVDYKVTWDNFIYSDSLGILDEFSDVCVVAKESAGVTFVVKLKTIRVSCSSQPVPKGD